MSHLISIPCSERVVASDKTIYLVTMLLFRQKYGTHVLIITFHLPNQLFDWLKISGFLDLVMCWKYIFINITSNTMVFMEEKQDRATCT
jgi:hypothetical protein